MTPSNERRASPFFGFRRHPTAVPPHWYESYFYRCFEALSARGRARDTRERRVPADHALSAGAACVGAGGEGAAT